MTLPSATVRNDYVGNSVTATFAYTFKVWASAELKVYLNNVLQSTGYTVTGVGSSTGGNVVFTPAPTTGVAVSIRAASAFTQATDLVNEASFRLETVEGGLDKIARAIQVSIATSSYVDITLTDTVAGDTLTTEDAAFAGCAPSDFFMVARSSVNTTSSHLVCSAYSPSNGQVRLTMYNPSASSATITAEVFRIFRCNHV